MSTASASQNHNFSLLREGSLPSLGTKTSYFRHQTLGAEHFHLHLEGGENSFLVAFRTLPEDSTGVAHILEHTSLCGSERFPVRDPFFLMLRRSLNSFMNAMTAADWTAYPFSTRNTEDYWNLMSVYLDAAFFPLLNPLDFAQEGHRLEFADPQQQSALLRGGVVYNEMKGAMSSSSALLWQGLTSHLCQGSTYQHVSGGDPQDIPQLSHEGLVAFHRHFYRPGNAIFMTAGDISPQLIQEKIEQLALSRMSARLQPPAMVQSAPRWSKPRSGSNAFPADSNTGDQVVTAWLLDRGADYKDRLHAELMASLLLGTSASPLRKALESSGLGDGLAPVSGLQEEQKDMVFACGLERVSSDRAEAVHQLIDDELRRIAREGVPAAHLEATLQQLEFGIREISGDSIPFGLELLLDALPPLVYGEQPEPALDPCDYMDQLRLAAAKKSFLPDLVKKLLLDNPHCLRYTLRADPDLLGKQQQSEQRQLLQLRQRMGAAELEQLRRQQAELAEHQAKKDDPEILPRVGVEHIGTELPLPGREEAGGASLYRAATNGISYLNMSFVLDSLSPAEAALLPFYCACAGNLGNGDWDYGRTQTERAKHLGGLRFSYHPTMTPDGRLLVWISLNTKALNAKTDVLCDFAVRALRDLRLDEFSRIGELRQQMLASRQRAIPASGHSLAMQTAQAGLSDFARLSHCSGGLAGLQYLAGAPELQTPQQLAEQLSRLHKKVLSAGWKTALVGDEPGLAALHKQAQSAGAVSDAPVCTQTQADLPSDSARDIGWLWQLPVNYCAQSVPAPSSQHPDAPALSVLSLLLRNRHLHTRIREQGGAYGAGASYSSAARTFSFFSYRDPQLQDTFDAFASTGEVLAGKPEGRAVEEAILGQISAIDSIGSPAGEAMSSFQRFLSGQSDEQLRDFRSRMLQVNWQHLQQVAEQYLSGSEAESRLRRCVLTSEQQRDTLQQLNFSIRELTLGQS